MSRDRAGPASGPEVGETATLVFEVGGAEAEGAGDRLDRFLAARTLGSPEPLSRTRAKGLIEAGRVSIDGALALEPSLVLRAGQSVRVGVPAAAEAAPRGEAIALAVVYEDAHLLVVDKPAGLVVHPGAGHDSGTLVNALIAHCGETLSGVGGVKRPGIVHRLDKDTSGLMVVAKTDQAHRGLSALFADHGRTLPLIREYLAFVWGAPDRTAGVVDAALARHAASREKIAVAAAGKGRRAITHWRLVERFGIEGAALACRLETGRTHQIRAHMASLGWPLMGDPLYAQGFKSKAARLGPAARLALERMGRQALHARALGFPHPVTGESLAFESEPPADMQALRAALREQEAGDGQPSARALLIKSSPESIA